MPGGQVSVKLFVLLSLCNIRINYIMSEQIGENTNAEIQSCGSARYGFYDPENNIFYQIDCSPEEFMKLVNISCNEKGETDSI